MRYTSSGHSQKSFEFYFMKFERSNDLNSKHCNDFIPTLNGTLRARLEIGRMERKRVGVWRTWRGIWGRALYYLNFYERNSITPTFHKQLYFSPIACDVFIKKGYCIRFEKSGRVLHKTGNQSPLFNLFPLYS